MQFRQEGGTSSGGEEEVLDSEGVGPSLLHQEPIEQQQEYTLTHG